MSSPHLTILIGAGTMGSAIASALVRAGADRVELANSTSESSRRAAAGLDGTAPIDVDDADAYNDSLSRADLIILGVKPYQMAAVLERIAPHLPEGVIVLSLASGFSIASIEAALPAGTAVVRAMPNTPVSVGEGVISLSRGSHAGDGEIDLLESAFTAAGTVVEVPEDQIHAIIAVAGSSPAYVFYLIEAMTDAAVAQGLRRPDARRLAVQAVKGSAVLLEESGKSATLAREDVTSPGGTTAQAVKVLDQRAVKSAIGEAMDAAAATSRAQQG